MSSYSSTPIFSDENGIKITLKFKTEKQAAVTAEARKILWHLIKKGQLAGAMLQN